MESLYLFCLVRSVAEKVAEDLKWLDPDPKITELGNGDFNLVVSLDTITRLDKESEILRLQEHLKNLSKVHIRMFDATIQFLEDNYWHQYECAYRPKRSTSPDFGFPDADRINVDYVQENGDRIFFIYNHKEKRIPGKPIGFGEIRFFVNNGYITFSVLQEISIKRMEDGKEYTYIGRKRHNWKCISLTVNSGDLKEVREAIRKEYGKKGFVLEDMKFERFLNEKDLDERKTLY